jgi:FAD-dependent urate hydroxylase
MTTISSTDVLIIGAGPFGLALASYLRHLGVEHRVVGRPMSFWKEQMPRGMLLRSGLDWHLDAEEEATLEVFIADRSLSGEEVDPLPLDTYLDYTSWFQARRGIEVDDRRIERMYRTASGGFLAEGDGFSLEARNVVVATGFHDFVYVPEELAGILPQGCYGHTCDIVDLDGFAGKSVLIVGGRQSAFEWAALLADAGAVSVDLTYRHETPRFEPSDWSWVGGLMARTEVEPGWYRRLDERERTELGMRFWGEGRLKLEPWLKPRLDKPGVRLHPGTQIVAAQRQPDGRVAVSLDSGESVTVDFVILATGYRVNLPNVTFLAQGDLLPAIETKNGAPALDEEMQSSVPGLYFTSMAATQDFGPFFAFTVSAKCSARLIGDSLARRVAT